MQCSVGSLDSVGLSLLNFSTSYPNPTRHTGVLFLPHSPRESTETGEDSRGSNMVLNPLGGPLRTSLGGGT